MIRKFEFCGFKRFSDKIVCDLDSITLFVGANNCGKSTILQALTFFQFCINSAFQQDNGQLNETYIQMRKFGLLPFADPDDLWPNGNTQNAICLAVAYDNGARVELNVSQILKGYLNITPKVDGPLPANIMDRQIRLIPVFSSLKPQENLLSPAQRKDQIRQQRNGEIIRNLLWDLHQNHQALWNLLAELLEDLFPGSSLSVNASGRVDDKVTVTRRDDILKAERDLMTAGAAFHQVLQILASALAPGAGTILLDEPDAHLHAQRQSKLMEVFERLADHPDNSLQFVLATHSPHVINSAPKNSLRVCNSGRIGTFDQDERNLLDNLGVIDRMQIVPLLKSRVIVFVEGKTDRIS